MLPDFDRLRKANGAVFTLAPESSCAHTSLDTMPVITVPELFGCARVTDVYWKTVTAAIVPVLPALRGKHHARAHWSSLDNPLPLRLDESRQRTDAPIAAEKARRN